MNILHIDSSILGENSASRGLTQAIVDQLRAQHPGASVTRMDLDADPLPHLSSRSLAGADATESARAQRALDTLFAADVVVIGAPMYNFSVPSTLKAWIDRVAVAGKTFRYTSAGPEGLLKGKRAILAITQGGVHEFGGASEHQESYLRFVLGFLGIDEVEVVRAQGLAMSAEHRAQALASARASLSHITQLAA